MHEIKNAKIYKRFFFVLIIFNALGPQTLNMLSPPHWHNSHQSIPAFLHLHRSGEQPLLHPQDMSTLDDTLASGKVVMVHRGVHLLGSSYPQYLGVGMSRLTCPDQQETNMQHLAPAVTTLVHCSSNVLLTIAAFIGGEHPLFFSCSSSLLTNIAKSLCYTEGGLGETISITHDDARTMDTNINSEWGTDYI